MRLGGTDRAYLPFMTDPDIQLTPSAAKRVATIAAKQAKPAVLRLAVEGGEMSAVLRFVEAGLGHAVVPGMVLATRPLLRATQLENPPLDRVIALAHRSSEALPLAARAFKAELLEHLRTVTTGATVV